jgi:CubicO group peptidase (beta-lactamase class C family)
MKFLSAMTCLAILIPQFSIANDIHDTKTLEAFIDGVIQSSMEEHHVAGTVVAITTPDKVLLSKGYGLADVENQVPVSPDGTLFRIGSVSKLFVWVPLMQLVEQGKLDLHTDINEYLTRVEIPPTFDEPITIADLMTHTPGFEEQVIGLFGKDASSMQPLADILNREMPLRVRPPGQYASYSNHGVGIAGLIIEEVTGQSWREYVQENVLTPLGMHMTSLSQPLPESLQQVMSKGYNFEGGKYVAKGFEFVPLAPAGAVSSTASDMTRYLQMFLNDGILDGTRVLEESTSQQMQSSLFRPVNGLNGIMHGLYETSSHGQLIMGHGGDTIWFHTEFMIMPDAGIGIYISTNSANGSSVRTAFKKAFLDRYFPVSPPAEMAFNKSDLGMLEGQYSAIRHSHDDLTKLLKLMAPVNITATEDGQLMLTGAMAGENPLYLDEVAPLIFRRAGYELKISFDLDNSGRASHLYIDELPVIAFERMSGLDSVPLNLFILFASLIVFTWVLVIWTVQHFLRRTIPAPDVAHFRTIAWLLALTVYLFFVGLTIGINDANAIIFGLSTAVKVILSVTYLIFALTLGIIWLVPGVLKAADAGVIAKTGYLAVTLTAIALSWFLYHWRIFAW